MVSILGFRTPGVGFRMFHVPFGTFAHFWHGRFFSASCIQQHAVLKAKRVADTERYL